MPRTHVIFDGHRLTDLCHVTKVELPSPSRAVTSRAVSGMDGKVVTGSRLEAAAITMQLNFLQETAPARIAAMDEVMSWLDVAEPRALSITSMAGRYWLAIPGTKGKRKAWATADAVQQVRFEIADPVMYGERRSVAVPSGGSVEFAVGGTYPAALRVAASAAVRGSSGFWGVRLDGGDYMRVALGSNTARAVDMDSANAAVRVAGDPALMTLDSDWIMLEPGAHTLAMDQGTGAATASWTERWL